MLAPQNCAGLWECGDDLQVGPALQTLWSVTGDYAKFAE